MRLETVVKGQQSLRNTLVVVGAYFLGAQVAVLLFWPMSLLIPTYSSGEATAEARKMAVIDAFYRVPIFMGAVLAGVGVGVCLQSARPRVWIVVTGVVVALCTLSSAAWSLFPLAQAVHHFERAVAAGLLSSLACLMTLRKRKAVNATA